MDKISLFLILVIVVIWCLFQARSLRPGIPIPGKDIFFIHVPKTGGTSITSYFCEQSFMRSILTAPKHACASGFPSSLQKQCIAVVRNPYDRVVSFFTYAQRSGNFYNRYGEKYYMSPYYSAVRKRDFPTFVKEHDKIMQECQWMKAVSFNAAALQMYMMHTQCYYLLDVDGSLHVTVLKYETLESDLSVVMGRDISLPNENVSRPKGVSSWREFYTQETADAVYFRFWKDFHRFGYDRESWRTG